MKSNETVLPSFDGTALYRRSLCPDTEIKGNVVYVHGLGDHSHRHETFARRVVESGFAFHAIDLRGHGRSPGKRGHIKSWDDYLADVGVLIRSVHSGGSKAPLMLAGHSMGGVIALDYAIRHQSEIAALVATSPALGEVDVPRFLMFLSKILSKVAPAAPFSSGLDVSGLSRDQSFVEETRRDPWYHGKGTPRLATEFTAAVKWVFAHAGQLKCPLLIVHGEADRVALPDGTRPFFAAAGSIDKELKFYPGAFHELDNDTDANAVMDDICPWLVRHAVSAPVQAQE